MKIRRTVFAKVTLASMLMFIAVLVAFGCFFQRRASAPVTFTQQELIAFRSSMQKKSDNLLLLSAVVPAAKDKFLFQKKGVDETLAELDKLISSKKGSK